MLYQEKSGNPGLNKEGGFKCWLSALFIKKSWSKPNVSDVKVFWKGNRQFKNIIFGPVPLFHIFNTQTMYIRYVHTSSTHNSTAIVSLPCKGCVCKAQLKTFVYSAKVQDAVLLK
jgi:hypothetical protein